MVAHFPFVLEK